MPKLFRGEFDTGTYPDEWHWREGISKPNAAREMCNAWKSSRTVASIVLNERLGQFIAQVMGWDSVRISQDDLVWKPPSLQQQSSSSSSSSSVEATVDTTLQCKSNRIDTVGFHQDSAYISTQFEPYKNNSVTLWMALDDADKENGCVEYAVGSHKWRPLLHQQKMDEGGDSVIAPSEDEETTTGAIGDEISSFHSSDETSYRDGLSLAAKLARVTNPHDTIESAPTKEGYAILHHQDMWHGSGPNLSTTRHRRALVAHYIQGDVTFRESAKKNNNDGTRNNNGPFGNATYIYGRYKRYNSLELDESFFPIIYGDARTVWLDDFLRV